MSIENGLNRPAQDGPVVAAGPPIGDEKTVSDKSKTEPRQIKFSANGLDAAPDPFNVDDLVVSQDYVQCCGPKQQLTIPKNKPGPKVFIRICPDPEYQKSFNILEFKDEGEVYIVKKSMAHILSGETYLATLYIGMTKQGTLFVWPMRLPDEEGKQLDCHKSGHAAAAKAMKGWVRVVWEKGSKSHAVIPAANGADFGDPEWTMPYMEILKTAFGDEGIIDSPDHVAVRKLRGQI